MDGTGRNQRWKALSLSIPPTPGPCSFVDGALVFQVLLVQLTERAQDEGAAARAPSAQVIRHLVAISKGGQGASEAIYSFSEVSVTFKNNVCHDRVRFLSRDAGAATFADSAASSADILLGIFLKTGHGLSGR